MLFRSRRKDRIAPISRRIRSPRIRIPQSSSAGRGRFVRSRLKGMGSGPRGPDSTPSTDQVHPFERLQVAAGRSEVVGSLRHHVFRRDSSSFRLVAWCVNLMSDRKPCDGRLSLTGAGTPDWDIGLDRHRRAVSFQTGKIDQHSAGSSFTPDLPRLQQSIDRGAMNLSISIGEFSMSPARLPDTQESM